MTLPRPCACALALAFALAAPAWAKGHPRGHADRHGRPHAARGPIVVNRALRPGQMPGYGRDGVLDPRFSRWDDDRDGVLSRWEWRRDGATFRRLDRNHDGVLTRSELDRY